MESLEGEGICEYSDGEGARLVADGGWERKGGEKMFRWLQD